VVPLLWDWAIGLRLGSATDDHWPASLRQRTCRCSSLIASFSFSIFSSLSSSLRDRALCRSCSCCRFASRYASLASLAIWARLPSSGEKFKGAVLLDVVVGVRTSISPVSGLTPCTPRKSPLSFRL